MKVVRDAIVIHIDNNTKVEEIAGCFYENIFFVIDGNFKNEEVMTAITRHMYPNATFLMVPK